MGHKEAAAKYPLSYGAITWFPEEIIINLMYHKKAKPCRVIRLRHQSLWYRPLFRAVTAATNCRLRP